MSDKLCLLKYQTQSSQIQLPQQLSKLKQFIQQKFNINDFNLNYLDGDDVLDLDYDDEYEVLHKLGQHTITILIQTKLQEENRLFKSLQKIYEQNKMIKITNYADLFRLHLDLLEREQKQLLDYSVCVPSDIKRGFYSPGTTIQQVIELQNIGYEQWPSITLMVLTENNIRLEFNILNLKPEQIQTITIKFECPQQEGNHRYIFRLQGYVDGQLSFFGPRMSIEFSSKFRSLEDKRRYIHNYIDHNLPKQECTYQKLVIDSKLDCNPEMTVSTALNLLNQ
ncbi:hypothetical protein pb186bvf_007159 [Paramecium bursaria]